MLHHLALTASSLGDSVPFYDGVLGALGYKRTLTRSDLAVWEGPEPEILLYATKAAQQGNAHRTYDPGIHHVAFSASSRAIVNQIHEFVSSFGAVVLNPPQEYPEYSPNYFATYFLDPDGVKLEVMSIFRGPE
jgi:catechol 2,3-dioxygenase-like lactoylglutathione lyase family enzyme